MSEEKENFSNEWATFDVIDDYLHESDDSTEIKLRKIEGLTAYLEYHKRFAELTDTEKEDFHKCTDDLELSESMRVTLDSCTTQEKRDYYLEMWSRSIYIKKCAWINYLRTGEKKPVVFSNTTKGRIDVTAN